MFSKYNKLLTMKSIYVSPNGQYLILELSSFFFLISVGVPPQWCNFDVEKLMSLFSSQYWSAAHSIM